MEKRICRDCRKIIGDFREPFYIGNSPVPVIPTNSYHCEDCYNRAIQDGFIFKSGQKTSPAIEQLVEESLLLAQQAANNQYF